MIEDLTDDDFVLLAARFDLLPMVQATSNTQIGPSTEQTYQAAFDLIVLACETRQLMAARRWTVTDLAGLVGASEACIHKLLAGYRLCGCAAEVPDLLRAEATS